MPATKPDDEAIHPDSLSSYSALTQPKAHRSDEGGLSRELGHDLFKTGRD